jgi:hypothetical protein
MAEPHATPADGVNAEERPARWPVALVFVGGYAVILLWFHAVDVYHAHFAQAGPLVLVHNVCRAVFIFYLFWIVHAAGALLLRAIGAALPARPLERIALTFFAGTGVWHVALLLLGYLGLYARPVMAALTLAAVALSYRDFRRAAAEMVELRAELKPPSRGWAVALVCVFVAVLMIKGLYPTGGHDYFTHYFYYDRAVVERGDLWPNELWYHYYYSKGAGLYFLAMLLTDPLAPQLVSFCFFAASLIVLFLLLRRVAPGTAWPWAGLVLFLALYVYTPGPGDSRWHGGWGDFEKLHELNAALTLGILWMAAEALAPRGREARAWMAGAISAIAAAVIINNTVAVYFGGLFAVLAVWFAVRGTWRQALACFVFAAIAGVVLAAMGAINYVTTGLVSVVSDVPIRLFWPVTDVEKLHRWGALPMVLIFHWGFAGLGALVVTAADTIRLLLKTLRLEMFGPLLAAGLLTGGFALARRRARLPRDTLVPVLTTALLVTVAIALSEGRQQAVSFYRSTSFVLPLVLLIGVLLIERGRRAAGTSAARWAGDARLPAVAVIACLVTAFISYHPRRSPADVILDAAGLTVGRYSIDRAYTTQEGWPGRRTWGAIHPAARAAYAIAGPQRRIMSMHSETYCMLPGCLVVTWPAFALPDWDRLMFGTPEEGREVLRAAGVDYFLFSPALYLYDPLPLSPLFSPDHIGRYLALRWTDGEASLLTWLGPDTTPLDAEWIARYRRAVEGSDVVQSFPYGTVRDVYAALRASPHPWRPFPLPWSAGAR